jgi:hypothetical protein
MRVPSKWRYGNVGLPRVEESRLMSPVRCSSRIVECPEFREAVEPFDPPQNDHAAARPVGRMELRRPALRRWASRSTFRRMGRRFLRSASKPRRHPDDHRLSGPNGLWIARGAGGFDAVNSRPGIPGDSYSPPVSSKVRCRSPGLPKRSFVANGPDGSVQGLATAAPRRGTSESRIR